MGGSRLFEYNIDIYFFRLLLFIFTSGLGERAINGPNTDLYVPKVTFILCTNQAATPTLGPTSREGKV
ncbi:hypothetical protein NC652_037914 [Populus alba x Populus x berolinensis]|nr:hypothetical protein NC652_037914 [Populus alba x Populus x berolinensis]